MKGNSLFGVIVLIVLGVFIAFSSVKKEEQEQISPDKLYNKVIQKTRFYTPDEVAKLIISKDPSLLLIDVRSKKFYNKFTLFGAINIPLKDILKPENLNYFDQDVFKTILFSNGTSDAEVAWILTNRLGYNNIYVMKGGLNSWVENILKPKNNSLVWDRINDEMYQYRKGASQYFGGDANTASENQETSAPKKPVIKHKKKEVEGGCG